MNIERLRRWRVWNVVSAVSVLAAAACALPASAATAPTVTLNFTGQYVLNSCAITGGADQTVTLPTVSATALAAATQTAGSTRFSISVNCDSGVTSVRAFFEAGSTVDASTGNLIGQAVTGQSTAGNVQIRLLGEDNAPIKIGDRTTMPVKTVGASGNVQLNYIAQYYATGAASAGRVQTQVTYVLELP